MVAQQQKKTAEKGMKKKKSICYTPTAVKVGDYRVVAAYSHVWSSSVFFFCFFLQLIYLVYQSVDYDDDASFNCFCAKGDGSRPLFVGVTQETKNNNEKHSYFSKLLANCQAESRVTPSSSSFSTRCANCKCVYGCALLFYCLLHVANLSPEKMK